MCGLLSKLMTVGELKGFVVGDVVAGEDRGAFLEPFFLDPLDPPVVVVGLLLEKLTLEPLTVVDALLLNLPLFTKVVWRCSSSPFLLPPRLEQFSFSTFSSTSTPRSYLLYPFLMLLSSLVCSSPPPPILLLAGGEDSSSCRCLFSFCSLRLCRHRRHCNL